jgi:hypothetical protein
VVGRYLRKVWEGLKREGMNELRRKRSHREGGNEGRQYEGNQAYAETQR